MKKYAFAALLAAIGLAACQPAPPPPPPPPPPVDITGQLRERAGACATIMGDNGTAYAVRPAALGPILVGSRVRVVGVVDPMQDCPGRTLVRADGGVSMIAPPPRMRHRRMTAPK
ncbi:MAG: hypothetical protein KIT16_16100 [Rhodospirillaceae bacterium]|nr:hypothetical protein [Rhodospirillaceae bacterium]